MMRTWKRLFLLSLALLAAAATWLPSMHLLFKPNLDDYVSPQGIPPRARALAARHLALWTDPVRREQEIARMRAGNAEWDFMARTYLVLALANVSLRDPASKEAYLEVMDRIIEETLRLEREGGVYYFLMDYARYGSFVSPAGRSLFLDGEIALMLAVRRLVEEKEAYRPLLAERVAAMVAAMEESPVLSGESYPDECWTFCNTVALAAIRVADVLDGTDHADFLARWVETARRHLVDAKTGLLISSYTWSGRPRDGPEGSTIWMAAHCLQLVDREFAEDQYRRARAELGASFLGFGYAREWPGTWVGPMDVDSGPVIPILGISPASSGLALLGATAFDDREYLAALLASLNLGGFPVERGGQLWYAASNQVGDAVMLYAMVQGPAWEEVERRAGRLP